MDFILDQTFFQKYKKPIIADFGGIVFMIFSYWIFISAPAGFPEKFIASVHKGDVLTEISASLKEDHLIRSEIAFQFFAILFSGDRRAVAGDYYFESKAPVWKVAWRIARGRYGLASVKATIPEGSTLFEESQILSVKIPSFNKDDFMKETAGKEGYLFPDTYFFFPTATADEIVKKISDTFSAKIFSINEDIQASGRKLSDLIIMASILEKEANKPEDRRIVSVIL